MPTQLRPASRVRRTDVHGGTEQGASASTNPSVGESKVTDRGVAPGGTGPPTGPGNADWASVGEVVCGATTVVDESAGTDVDDVDPGVVGGGGGLGAPPPLAATGAQR